MTDLIYYPSISVVIPSFNQGQYIEETLLSILNQEYPNLEILVIDGGSTDNTVEIIQRYSEQITYWQSKKDRGQADAINQGMSRSSGEVMCWLNSDDMYLPGTLLDIGKRFNGFTEQNHLIYGNTAIVKQKGDKHYPRGYYTASPFDPFMLTYRDFVSQPSSFWTRKLWQKVGELNADYHYVLDWDWFLRASKVVKFEYVPKPYAIYRYHSAHKTSTGGLKRRKEVASIVEKYSTPYWADLYAEVEDSYRSIRVLAKLFSLFKFPEKSTNLLISALFSNVGKKLQDPLHLSKVMGMYG